MMVSAVGRTISGSSSLLAGSGISLPSSVALRRVWVTMAASLAKPSTCCRLALQKALGDEQRKVRVLVPRLLEAQVQPVAHQLPQPVAVGADDHAAAHGRVVRQLGLEHHFVVPGAEVLRLGRKRFFVGHEIPQIVKGPAASGGGSVFVCGSCPSQAKMSRTGSFHPGTTSSPSITSASVSSSSSASGPVHHRRRDLPRIQHDDHRRTRIQVLVTFARTSLERSFGETTSTARSGAP